MFAVPHAFCIYAFSFYMIPLPSMATHIDTINIAME